jgi:hypothetical protein
MAGLMLVAYHFFCIPQQVKDQINQSGSGGLFDALVRFALPHEV